MQSLLTPCSKQAGEGTRCHPAAIQGPPLSLPTESVSTETSLLGRRWPPDRPTSLVPRGALRGGSAEGCGLPGWTRVSFLRPEDTYGYLSSPLTSPARERWRRGQPCQSHRSWVARVPEVSPWERSGSGLG